MTVIAVLLSVGGFYLLAAAMDRHAGLLPGGRRPGKGLLRLGAGVLLLSALALMIRALGPGYGLVAWCGVLSAGAAPVLLWLSWRQRRGRRSRHG